MGGGLMQLVAYGAQDIYLTGNPQITFFKVVYRRHTNFSMESIKQTWNGDNIGTTGRCTSVISRNGDLVYRMYLQFTDVTVKNDEAITKGDTKIMANPTAAAIEEIELEIGGQRIDKQSGTWMEIYSELTEENPNGMTANSNKNNLVNGYNFSYDAADRFRSSVWTSSNSGTKFQKMSGMGGNSVSELYISDYGENDNNYAYGFSTTCPETFEYIVPLKFWFCRNPGLALPLIALQYHEVKVILQHKFGTVFKSASDSMSGIAGVSTKGFLRPNDNFDLSLWCDYIYLDTDERRRFAQVSHEYLIEQVQEQNWDKANNDLNFNHPVKELIWCKSDMFTKSSKNTLCKGEPIGEFDVNMNSFAKQPAVEKDSMAYLTDGELECNWTINLNGNERFAPRNTRYFSRVQVKDYHTGAGGLCAFDRDLDIPEYRDGYANAAENHPLPNDFNLGTLRASGMSRSKCNDSILVYSFALKPEEHQPSGTCNFSRIDNAKLELSSDGTNDWSGNSMKVYAVNYNVLRIMSGMGGLAYSN